MRTSRRETRGQSLVLFALTILLLTLMVMMTLGIGMKAKEKMELQHMADAAAYSNAVYTARALNGVAILNRAEVSVMVALAATQSNISYASAYMGGLKAVEARLPLNILAATACCLSPFCPFQAPCCTTATRQGEVLPKIGEAYDKKFTDYYENGKQDHKAGLQARDLQGAATDVHQRQKEIYQSMLGGDGAGSPYPGFINNQRLAKAIVEEAKMGTKSSWRDELQADDAADAVSVGELKTKFSDPTAGPESGDGEFYALSPRNVSRELGVDNAMGARGDAFVRDRDHGAFTMPEYKQDLGLNPPEFLMLMNGGSGHWSTQRSGRPHPLANDAPPAPYSSAADDHGNITGIIGQVTCPASYIFAGYESYVYSTDDSTDDEDKHVWTGEGADHAGGDVENHTMGECTACPGVWTMFIDLNPEIIGTGPQSAKVQQWLWGQPKNMAVIRRDTNVRCSDVIYGGDCGGADPWNFNFNFKFSQGERFDNRGMFLTGGEDISNQIAVGTGVTYYHRPEYWEEPPNFFNPFWRATLTSVTVDAQGNPRTGSDLADSVEAGGDSSGSTAAAVIEALEGADYEGW